MSYRITLAWDLFPNDGSMSEEETNTALRIALVALLKRDVDYLRRHPNTPRVYDSGVVYQRLKVPVIAGAYGADAASVAHDAVTAAQARQTHYLFVDTAGVFADEQECVGEAAAGRQGRDRAQLRPRVVEEVRP